MNKIKIITDSTSYIDKDYALEKDISIIPLSYTFEGETYKEGFTGEFDDFFERLSKSKDFPVTSQPSTGDFLKEYEEALKKYDEIVVLTISSKLSGTYNNALLARSMSEEDRIFVVDSKQAASNLKILVEDAIDMIESGKNREEIISHIVEKEKRMAIYFTVGTLEYLKRGGRLSAISSIIGSVLNIKPIISFKDGELGLLEKTRGKNKAVKKIIETIPSDVKRIGVCHILNYDEAVSLKEKLIEEFPKALITIDELGPIVGAHLGPETIGVCYSC
ncbi:MAG TPA: DegV family protein [Tissierellia bacterium]|nr:DegV family protein [Tissierellia bacterium]